MVGSSKKSLHIQILLQKYCDMTPESENSGVRVDVHC
jgi:hypothetical protein